MGRFMGTCSHVQIPALRQMRLTVENIEIRRAIERLVGIGVQVTTRRLRAELKRSCGHFGNSVRVHRILQETKRQAEISASPKAKLEEALEQTRQEVAAWRKRAELAAHRERTHQDKWAREIHELRQALHEARKAIPAANAMSADYLKLYADRERLAARVKELEVQIERTQVAT
jgi:hypothetical protein